MFGGGDGHARRGFERHQLATRASVVQRLMVHMATEHITDIRVSARGIQAQCRRALVFHISPTLRRIGTGVYQQHVVDLCGERQDL